jgi:hypothetical protein
VVASFLFRPHPVSEVFDGPVLWDLDHGCAVMRATYGDNYARLVEVKTAYDPDSVFSSTQNIPPAQASSV